MCGHGCMRVSERCKEEWRCGDMRMAGVDSLSGLRRVSVRDWIGY
jgi:hypothetical protein